MVPDKSTLNDSIQLFDCFRCRNSVSGQAVLALAASNGAVSCLQLDVDVSKNTGTAVRDILLL